MLEFSKASLEALKEMKDPKGRVASFIRTTLTVQGRSSVLCTVESMNVQAGAKEHYELLRTVEYAWPKIALRFQQMHSEIGIWLRQAIVPVQCTSTLYPRKFYKSLA